ncbi:MAG: MFS transporter [Dermatophilaceae bacterium]
MTAAPGADRPWPLAFVLAGASFLLLFDSLAVATALPTIGSELDLRPGVLQWVVSAYSASIGAFLLLGGRMCDLWGRRRTLAAGLVVCTVGGLVAGAASFTAGGLGVLLTGRVLQGVAAAFALPAAMAAAASAFEREPWRSRVFAVLAFAAWAAAVGGATLGGLITDAWGWPWVFWVTVPVGVVLVVLTAAVVPDDGPSRLEWRRLDVTGALLATAGLAVLVLGAEELGAGEHPVQAVVVLGVGGVLLAALVLVETRTAHPLVRPALVRHRRVIGSCLPFAGYCAGYTAVVVVGAQMLQQLHGLSAGTAGLALVPMLLAGMASSALTAAALRRISSVTLVVGTLIVCTTALVGLAVLGPGGAAAAIPWLVLWGAGSGPVYVALTRICVAGTPEPDRGVVAGVFESMSHVGGALAVAGLLGLLGAGADFRTVLLVGAGAVGVGALSALLLPRDDADADDTRDEADPRVAAQGERTDVDRLAY